MNIAFFVSAAVAIAATIMAITRLNAIHALLYFIVSLLAVAVIFFILGAPLAAALVIIINAGAIMVLFVFAIMMLNLGPEATPYDRESLNPRVWIGPSILALIVAGEVIIAVIRRGGWHAEYRILEARQVGAVLFGPYVLCVELASMLLLAGILGAYHLGRKSPRPEGEDR